VQDGQTARDAKLRAGFILLAAALILASQLWIVGLAPQLTHQTATQLGTVMPVIAALSIAAACALLAAVQLERARPPQAFTFVLLFGLALRLIWLGAPAPIEDDYHRYLWDGAVLAHGYNPYTLAPADMLAAAGRGELPPDLLALVRDGEPTLARINFPDLRTIYPGTAQAVFALAHLMAPWSLDGLRLLFLAADGASALLLAALLAAAGRSPLWAALYWCNPFLSQFLIGAAHADALLPPLVLGALLLTIRGRAVLPCLLIGFAAGVKLWPLLLAPLLLRPHLTAPRRLLAGFLALAIPTAATLGPLLHASVTAPNAGLAAYASGWANNNAVFMWALEALRPLFGDGSAEGALRLVLAGAGAAIAIGVAFRPPSSPAGLIARALIVAAGAFYCAPAQFPWYASWFLPLAAALQFWPLLAVSALLPAYYLFFPFWGTPHFVWFSHVIALAHAIPPALWLMWRAAGGNSEHTQGASLAQR
jgi:hypothetical protein